MDKQHFVRGMSYEQYQKELIEILESIDPEKPDSVFLGALETLIGGVPEEFVIGATTTVAIRRKIIFGSFSNLLTQLLLEADVRAIGSQLGIELSRGLERVVAENLITRYIWMQWAEIVYCTNLLEDERLIKPTVDGVEKIMAGVEHRFNHAVNMYLKVKKHLSQYPDLRVEITADKGKVDNIVDPPLYEDKTKKKPRKS